MKISILLLTMHFFSFTYGQKKLTVDNINTIPVGNELGLVREYSKDEILTFIEMSGWESFYEDQKGIVPKVIFRMSYDAIRGIQVEAKNTWYLGIKNSSSEELRKNIVQKYGEINATSFKKFGILLITLEKIDRQIHYAL